MAVNSGQYNSFLQGFMGGFSFIDDMYARRRQEKRVDEERAERSRYRQLAERRAQLGFEQRTTAFDNSLQDRLRRIKEEEKQSGRRETVWERQDEDREFQLQQRQIAEDERLRNMSRREASEEGLRLLAEGASLDELRPYAQYNEAIMRKIVAEDDKARAMNEQVDALGTLSGLQNNGLNQPGAAAAAAGGAAPGAEQEPGDLLAPSRGMDTLQSVDIGEQLNDPEMTLSDVGFLGEAGRRIAGTGRAVTTGMANTVQSVTGGQPVASGASFAETGGNVYLPESFSTDAEMEGMNDEQRRQALIQNEEIRTQIKDRASDPKLDPRDKLREGSRELVAERRADMEQTRSRWHDFQVVSTGDVPRHLEGNEPLSKMAQEDPVAFSLQYFEDRATIKAEGDLDVVGMDYLVRPFVRAAETQLSTDVESMEPGSAEQKAASRQLRALQLTQEQMYEDYKAPERAGIRANGMPVGNPDLTNRLAQEMQDPDRPAPPASGPTGDQMRPALTTATRLAEGSGTSRLSRKQIEHLVMLKDYGLLTPQDVTTAAMTGKLPETVKGKIKQLTPGKPVYRENADGSMTYLFTPPEKGGQGDIDRTKTPQITLDAVEQIKIGVAMSMPDASPEFYRQLELSLLEDESWLEELPYDMTDPIHQRKIGLMYAQAHKLSQAEAFLPNWAAGAERLFGERPTARELLQSPQMAARIAKEKGMEIDIPAQAMDGLEVNNMRNTILQNPNAYEDFIVGAAQGLNDEELVEFLYRYDVARGNPPSTGE